MIRVILITSLMVIIHGMEGAVDVCLSYGNYECNQSPPVFGVRLPSFCDRSTTQPPETTTAPPGSTTQPPETTTAPPGSTTQPPETTTSPPGSTTQPPETTTAPPGSTTQPPETTTAPPGSTTQPPETTTAPPGTTTQPLETTTIQEPTTSHPPTTATPACLEDPTGVKYRGNLSQTINGHTCQAWTSQSPHRHDRTPANYPNAGLDENYCRNPGNEDTAWCYTTNSEIRWTYCAVGYLDPRCQEKPCLVPRNRGPVRQFVNGDARRPITSYYTLPTLPAGTQLVARCRDPGMYRLIGDQRRTCQEGQWTGEETECQPVETQVLLYGAPRDVASNGTVVVYVHRGNPNYLDVVCFITSLWLRPPRLTTPLVNDGDLWNWPKLYTDTKRLKPISTDFSGMYTCNGSSSFHSIHVLFKAAECDAPAAPVHGRLLDGSRRQPRDIFPSGTSVSFECEDDYRLVGYWNITCEKGQWSDGPPVCTVSRCPVLNIPDHVVIEGVHFSDGRNIGDERIFNCVEGYVLRGDTNNLRCLESGVWSDPLPTCEVLSSPGAVIRGIVETYENYTAALDDTTSLAYKKFEKKFIDAIMRFYAQNHPEYYAYYEGMKVTDFEKSGKKAIVHFEVYFSQLDNDSSLPDAHTVLLDQVNTRQLGPFAIITGTITKTET